MIKPPKTHRLRRIHAWWTLDSVPRWLPWLLFVALLAHRWTTLDNPPFWDATWTTAVGASELARTDMDLVALIKSPDYTHGGGVGAHSTSFYTMFTGLLMWLTGPEVWLPLTHLLSVALGAMLVHGTYLLARIFIPRRLAFATGAAVVTIPLVLQQVSDIYLDLPVAVLLTYTTWASITGRPVLATLFAALATGIKPTGLIGVALVPFSLKTRPRLLRQLSLVLIAASPITIYLIRTFILGNTSTLPDRLFLLKNALVSLGITIDVLILAFLGAFAIWRSRRSQPALATQAAVVLVGFFLLNGIAIAAQRLTILPRYFVIIIPVTVAIIAIDAYRRFGVRGTLIFISVLVGFSLMNQSGNLYPVANHPHPVYAERSLRAAEYLDLQMMATRALADTTVSSRVVDVHMQMRMLYPELGFLDSPATNLTSLDDLPDRFTGSVAWVVEPHGVRTDSSLMTLAINSGLAPNRTVLHDGRWSVELVVATP